MYIIKKLTQCESMFGACILLCIGLISGIFYSSKFMLQNDYYVNESAKISNSVSCVLISDLHNSEFGDSNKNLIDAIKTANPDLILITGDLMNSDEESLEIAINFLSEVSKVSPTYVSLGNHEVFYEETHNFDIINGYEKTGVTVLDQAYRDIEINGQKLRIGGIYGYCLPEKYLSSGEANKGECDFLDDFQNTEAYTILMCHMPVCWLLNDGLDEWDVDCVFSGHVHGGQVILPFIGGIYAPDFGWFPGTLSGVFHSSDGEKSLVLSRGLGSNEKIPRWNNRPEIVVVDLVSENEKTVEN